MSLDLSRRTLIFSTVLAGGALLVGRTVPGLAAAKPARFADFGPFLRIGSDGTITIIAKYAELGQGAQSGMAALVADELDADWSKVRVETAPADPITYGRPAFKMQITGGSASISDSWLELRRTGAAARAVLLEAAAAQWRVPVADLSVTNGTIAHAASKRSAPFAQFLEAAAKLTPPTDPVLKRPDQFRLIGTEKVTRLDARAKSNGTAIFTQDVRLPDMLVAMVAHSPRFGGVVKSFDDKAARAVPGVVDIFQIPSGVAVVARDTFSAKTGREALSVEWDDAQAETRSSDAIQAQYQAMAAGQAKADWAPFVTKGDVAPALSGKGRIVTLDVAMPFLAHATMEPMNCVAQVDGTRCRLTFGTQSHTADQRNIARLLGGKPEEVEIVTLPAGGSFGRRSVATSDYQKEAVSIARHVGGFRPVKLVWTREDDMAGGYYRPLTHHRARVALDKDGYPTAWEHRLVTASLLRGTMFEAAIKNGVERHGVEGVIDSPYLAAVPAVDARVFHPPEKIPVLWLRSVGATHTAMAMEHMVDQLARQAGIDPATYRRTLYTRANATSHLAVLEAALEKSGWGSPLESGWARGLAVHACFGSTVANVAEVSLENGEPRVRRVTVVVDCGTAVAPDQVQAQMEGGLMYGLSYSLYGEVKIVDGVVERTNFDSYRVLRMEEAPQVTVHILPSTQPPTGVGEPGTPVIGPAVANAILALTGKPVTRLPLVRA
ncbi:xanthine dehydrogenase family protein molybdopterin-binding subunit [Niveispirillum sp.]|uniref:xanthine dehydrogenase family protein molybdopterin-binding subunit n=1 Tax=Niveispirillum sp. TaxID=1917217 RepID=UPI001B51AEAF|nr:xanthine dehydrogenase family protein molybdopterin-binding subunit [Niveispirillum sp.]MBP7336276.1 xanthine dehydrogenase family protein molybdopterin-binding subunit [Niveispirillum sp.]